MRISCTSSRERDVAVVWKLVLIIVDTPERGRVQVAGTGKQLKKLTDRLL